MNAPQPTSLAMLPHEAEIVERIEESPTIFTLRLRFTDPAVHQAYSFRPGQFNMLYLHGVGEVPISIVSDPEDEHMYDHTIRIVGRITRGLAALKVGDRIGVRGAFGRGWPVTEAEGRDVIIATGGLGCAPVVSVINYVLRRRERYGRLVIMQGVKHAADLIWQKRYEEWARLPNTQVLLAASQGGQGWPFRVGHIPVLFDEAHIDPARSIVMMCGPEGMMRAVIDDMLKRGIPEQELWLSMERNMQCGAGRCGHCQHGGNFVCKDGPVFCYPEVKELLGVKGF
ncbi:MAG: FAD/NAD(P)-binding protein [Pseudomonadota bacterium]